MFDKKGRSYISNHILQCNKGLEGRLLKWKNMFKMSNIRMNH
jgi:hypothetical protein